MLLDHKDIDINARKIDNNTPSTKAVSRSEHQYIFMEILKNPNFRLDNSPKDFHAHRLAITGKWNWKEVEAALIGISVKQVSTTGDDGFNHLALYGQN